MKQYDFWINDQFQKDDENAIIKGILSYLPGSHVFLQRIPFNDSSLLTIITEKSLRAFADQVTGVLEQFTEEVDVKIDEVGPLFTYRYKLESIPKRQEKQLIQNIQSAFGFLNYPIISLFTPESVDHTFLTVETVREDDEDVDDLVLAEIEKFMPICRKMRVGEEIPTV